MLLKRRQDGFVGEGRGRVCLHAADIACGVLTDGSAETASTSKIVSDVGNALIGRCAGER